MSRPTRLSLYGFILIVTGLLILRLSDAMGTASADWPSYLHDSSRSGYNSSETVITSSTVPNLTGLWTDTAGGSVYPQPVIVGGVLYYGSWDGYIHAVSASTGTPIWSKFIGQTSDSSCNPPVVGVASTPTVSNGVVYVGGGDANFYALDASTGNILWQTSLGTSPDTFNWSSPLVANGYIYEGLASFGDCPLIRGGIVAMDPSTGNVVHTLYTSPSGCTGASVWGSPVLDPATGDVYFGTGNADDTCGNSGEPLAVALVQTDKDLNLLSSWQVPPASQTTDSDFGSTPTIFHATISGIRHNYVGLANKNGIDYAFDVKTISSGPVWQKKLANAGSCPQCGRSDISPMAYANGKLYASGGKTSIGGKTCSGGIRRLSPGSGGINWSLCLPTGPVLGAITAVNGVVFANAGNTIYAVNSATGAILWKFTDTSSGSNFWGAPSVSGGILYTGNQDHKLYAFSPA